MEDNNTDKKFGSKASKLSKSEVEIIPALMPENFEDIEEYAREFAGVVQSVQIDVMDGKFVPAQSWPYTKQQDESFEKITTQNKGLPEWKRLDYEADLMISNPEEETEKWIASGVKRIIFHIESIKNPQEFFARSDIANLSNSDFIELGIAVNIDTSLDVLAPFIEKISFVQCMGIARIGYQGQEFDERVLHNIEYLRSTYPGLIISVDGGVDVRTAPLLVRAGANRLVSGSAILTSDNSQDAIKELQKVSTKD